jgi:glucan phosphoethanolaminetransferase (alkaline phosphatase superfamily)
MLSPLLSSAAAARVYRPTTCYNHTHDDFTSILHTSLLAYDIHSHTHSVSIYYCYLLVIMLFLYALFSLSFARSPLRVVSTTAVRGLNIVAILLCCVFCLLLHSFRLYVDRSAFVCFYLPSLSSACPVLRGFLEQDCFFSY